MTRSIRRSILPMASLLVAAMAFTPESLAGDFFLRQDPPTSILHSMIQSDGHPVDSYRVRMIPPILVNLEIST